MTQVPLQLVCPDGQHSPLEQLPEQQSPFPLQEPLVLQQMPFWQFWPDEQALPHEPQLLLSLLRSLQLLLQQAGVVPVQVVPQAPQLLTSVCSLTQVPLQLLCPDGQAHVPL